jgi:hypothetical protein
MSKFNEITKEQFESACNKFPPSKFIKFAYRFFSKKTDKETLKLKNNVVMFFIGMFLFGFFGTVFNTSKSFIAIFTGIYGIALLALVTMITIAAILNNKRLNKIRKELGVTKDEYQSLLNIYS